MNDTHKRHYRARMAVAQLFRAFLNHDGERAGLMERLGVQTLPVIVPALGDTLASHVREAVERHCAKGDKYVIVPVCLPVQQPNAMKLCVLIASLEDNGSFWQVNLGDLPDSARMSYVVEALDSNKKWDVSELDFPEQQELKDLVSAAL